MIELRKVREMPWNADLHAMAMAINALIDEVEELRRVAAEPKVVVEERAPSPTPKPARGRPPKKV